MKTLIKFPENNGVTASANMLYRPFNFFDDVLSDYFKFESTINGINDVKWYPATNIKENDKSFIVELAVPGMTKKDFKIECHNGYLTITGERKEEKNDDTGSYRFKEMSYGKFSRTFTLSDNADDNNITADYSDGIIRVNIPKKKSSGKTVKEIKIN